MFIASPFAIPSGYTKEIDSGLPVRSSRKLFSQGGRDRAYHRFHFWRSSPLANCSVHVSDPLLPVIVYGVGVDEVQTLHDSAVTGAVAAVKGGKTRKIRSDQKTLHTVVASHPFTMEEVRANKAKHQEAEDWERRTIEWLRTQYGNDLQSVIRHEDEAHWHIHAYVLPLSDPHLKAQVYHPGVMAKREVMASDPIDGEGARKRNMRADAAYKDAMRRWQDSYHNAVAVPCGLTRLGPQRRRLTRAEWHREKTQARSLQKTVQHAKAVKADGEAFIVKTKTEAARIAADAARAQEDARKATAAALAAQDSAQQERQKAHEATADAARYGDWFGRFRAIWDGLRKSRLIEKVRAELSSEIERWKDVAQTAERRRSEAERQRHEAEKKRRML